MGIIDNRTYNIIKISCALGAGSNKAVRLCETLNNTGALDYPPSDLIKSGIPDGETLARIRAVSDASVKSIAQDCAEYGISVFTIFDKEYPERLRNIPAPPVVLYVKGNFACVDSVPVFCIVGPRRVSKFGEKAAFSLSRRLSKAGMVVVSGEASGSDTYTHLGALDVKAPSVMVAADGIVTQIKSSNRTLCERVIERGCIISENPPKFVAKKYSFPIRNRIMSGLSLGIAVIEAPEFSGTLITASHALEQGRDVFVIPGNPADKHYIGSNALLRDGAIPLIDTSDIFTRYIAEFPDKIDIEKAFAEEDRTKSKKIKKNKPQGLSNEALLVYNNLVKPEFTVDDFGALGIDGGALLSALTELEMEHYIKSLPGGLYKISDWQKEF